MIELWYILLTIIVFTIIIVLIQILISHRNAKKRKISQSQVANNEEMNIDNNRRSTTLTPNRSSISVHLHLESEISLDSTNYLRQSETTTLEIAHKEQDVENTRNVFSTDKYCIPKELPPNLHPPQIHKKRVKYEQKLSTSQLNTKLAHQINLIVARSMYPLQQVLIISVLKYWETVYKI